MTSSPTHWLIRVGDGVNFWKSAPRGIWGINSVTNSNGKHFIKNARNGDILWFIKNKTEGQAIAVATFTKTCERELGPLVSLTASDEELGWKREFQQKGWDTEVHYEKLYDIQSLELRTKIKGQNGFKKYKSEEINVDLISEYANIVRYSSVTALNL